MSFFEKIVPAFIRGNEKIPVDPGKNHNLPVRDQLQLDLLEEIRDLLKVNNAYLSELVGDEINPDEL